MKYIKKDIGKATNRNGMILTDIEPLDNLSREYTKLPDNCYTYGTDENGDSVGYYWKKKTGGK